MTETIKKTWSQYRESKYSDRKFLMEMIGLVAGTVGLFTGHITGDQYNFLVIGILSAHALNKWQEANDTRRQIINGAAQ